MRACVRACVSLCAHVCICMRVSEHWLSNVCSEMRAHFMLCENSGVSVTDSDVPRAHWVQGHGEHR